jgi:hypothetical protein
MVTKSNYRVKVLQALSKTLRNEEMYLGRYSRLAKVCGMFGGLFVTLALISAFRIEDQNAIWFVSFGFAGGLLIGLSYYFVTSVQQWPIFRKFFDEKAIHEAARNEEL